MNKLQYHNNKILKLNNVLKFQFINQVEEINFEAIIEQMQSYIKTKGAEQIGPIIQYINPCLNDNGELDMRMFIMLQCSNYICDAEKPYMMEATIRVSNCMYCRYIGSESKMKFAYDKINLEAFENNINLKGESYTILVDRNEEEDTITADVFMPRASI